MMFITKQLSLMGSSFTSIMSGDPAENSFRRQYGISTVIRTMMAFVWDIMINVERPTITTSAVLRLLISFSSDLNPDCFAFLFVHLVIYLKGICQIKLYEWCKCIMYTMVYIRITLSYIPNKWQQIVFTLS